MMMVRNAFLILGSTLALACGSGGESDGSGGSTSNGGAGGMGGTGTAGSAGSAGASGSTGVTPPPSGERHTLLSEWNLFTDIEAQTPNDRVVPYTVNSSLFSDYTNKFRFIYIPEGQTIGYQDEDRWNYPVGTVLVKTFAYLNDLRDPAEGRRLLETRLLHRESETVWKPHTYVYEETNQTDAERRSGGTTLQTSWTHFDGATRTNDYGVPENNQCEKCHGAGEDLNTIGGRTRQMNGNFDYGNGMVNQIDHLESLGLFDRTPPEMSARETLVDPLGSDSLSDRTRAYLDANCGHCHSPGAFAGDSGFWLDYGSTDPAVDDPTNWGVCKIPTSAGRGNCGHTFDVVPSDPETSIIVCRVETRDPTIQMPPLATKLVDEEGTALLREWITAMAPVVCN